MKTRGFIGLGVMGFPMAGYISKKYPTLVFNRSVAKAENWVKTYKGEIAKSLAELGNVCAPCGAPCVDAKLKAN